MPVDIEESKNFIRSHARACYGDPENPAAYECCGLIVKVGKKQEVICCRNVAEDPRHAFFIHPDDAAAAYDRGEVIAIYHSHCNESPAPSAHGDIPIAEKQGLPIFVVSWPADQWDMYTPTGKKADLIGRPFVFGVQDCLTLLQDYFLQEEGIVIPPFDYEPRFWDKGKDLYNENLPKHFVKVDATGIRRSDAILMKLEADLPNHIAVYVGDGNMLHHPNGHLSGEHPYVYNRGYYALRTESVWRHKELL